MNQRKAEPLLNTEEYLRGIYKNTYVRRACMDATYEKYYSKLKSLQPYTENFTITRVSSLLDILIHTNFNGDVTKVFKGFLGAYYDRVGWNNIVKGQKQTETNFKGSSKKHYYNYLKDREKLDHRTLRFKISEMMQKTNYKELGTTSEEVFRSVFYDFLSPILKKYPFMPRGLSENIFYYKVSETGNWNFYDLSMLVYKYHYIPFLQLLGNLSVLIKERHEVKFEKNFATLIELAKNTVENPAEFRQQVEKAGILHPFIKYENFD